MFRTNLPDFSDLKSHFQREGLWYVRWLITAGAFIATEFVVLQVVEDMYLTEPEINYAAILRNLQDKDNDGSAMNSDCDDEDSSRFPGAAERCDHKDNNCNGAVDEVASVHESLLLTLYQDADADGRGNPKSWVKTCFLGTDVVGYVPNADDCNDADTNAWDTCATCVDTDEDGYPGTCNRYTTRSPDCDDTDRSRNNDDADGDGVTTCAGDCDDQDNRRAPAFAEICDLVDNDCDEQTDEDLSTFVSYTDEDGDGFGVKSLPFVSCLEPHGFSTLAGDCNDQNADIFPGAGYEYCDLTDWNCDGWEALDPTEALDSLPWYQDTDHDGYGDPTAPEFLCDVPSQQQGRANNGRDCNDADPLIHPDADETCGDEKDQNCDGMDLTCIKIRFRDLPSLTAAGPKDTTQQESPPKQTIPFSALPPLIPCTKDRASPADPEQRLKAEETAKRMQAQFDASNIAIAQFGTEILTRAQVFTPGPDYVTLFPDTGLTFWPLRAEVVQELDGNKGCAMVFKVQERAEDVVIPLTWPILLAIVEHQVKACSDSEERQRVRSESILACTPVQSVLARASEIDVLASLQDVVGNEKALDRVLKWMYRTSKGLPRSTRLAMRDLFQLWLDRAYDALSAEQRAKVSADAHQRKLRAILR